MAPSRIFKTPRNPDYLANAAKAQINQHFAKTTKRFCANRKVIYLESGQAGTTQALLEAGVDMKMLTPVTSNSEDFDLLKRRKGLRARYADLADAFARMKNVGSVWADFNGTLCCSRIFGISRIRAVRKAVSAVSASGGGVVAVTVAQSRHPPGYLQAARANLRAAGLSKLMPKKSLPMDGALLDAIVSRQAGKHGRKAKKIAEKDYSSFKYGGFKMHFAMYRI